jgi:sRNA-binding protein
MATSKSETAEIIAELSKLYPGAFTIDPSRVRPLAIGVKEVLLQRCKLSPKGVGDALRHYTGSRSYLKATVEGAVRIDLDGHPVGIVTMRQAENAQRRLANVAERLPAKPNPATTKAVAKPQLVTKGGTSNNSAMKGTTAAPILSAPQTEPRRLGLADLKRAAAARRTVPLAS